MRLVLDTDVVLSGLRSTVGASRVLLQAVDAGVVRPLVSVATLMEYEAVLKRADNLAGMRLDDAAINRFLDDFVGQAEEVDIRFRTRPSVRDANDELFAELAINGQADALVSFNVGDYRPADPTLQQLHIPVLRPGEMLKGLTWRPQATSHSGSHPR